MMPMYVSFPLTVSAWCAHGTAFLILWPWRHRLANVEGGNVTIRMRETHMVVTCPTVADGAVP